MEAGSSRGQLPQIKKEIAVFPGIWGACWPGRLLSGFEGTKTQEADTQPSCWDRSRLSISDKPFGLSFLSSLCFPDSWASGNHSHPYDILFQLQSTMGWWSEHYPGDTISQAILHPLISQTIHAPSEVDSSGLVWAAKMHTDGGISRNTKLPRWLRRTVMIRWQAAFLQSWVGNIFSSHMVTQVLWLSGASNVPILRTT